MCITIQVITEKTDKLIYQQLAGGKSSAGFFVIDRRSAEDKLYLVGCRYGVEFCFTGNGLVISCRLW